MIARFKHDTESLDVMDRFLNDKPVVRQELIRVLLRNSGWTYNFISSSNWTELCNLFCVLIERDDLKTIVE